MPGRPSTTSDIESPTGWTKQLIRVAWSCTPAAELMRPAGMKPSSWAWKKRRSHCGRSASRSTWARARATRRRTSVTVCSEPLAYFSISVSRLIVCSPTGLGNWISIQYCGAAVDAAQKPTATPKNYCWISCRGRRGLGLFGRGCAAGGGTARLLERVGDLGVAEAQRELDRGVAFLGGL